jgi:hypothetical protein
MSEAAPPVEANRPPGLTREKLAEQDPGIPAELADEILSTLRSVGAAEQVGRSGYGDGPEQWAMTAFGRLLLTKLRED